MNYEFTGAVAVGIGLLFGALVAIAIIFANIFAAKFNRGDALLDVLLRLGSFGALVLTVSELLGSFWGVQLRQHTILFWGSFALGFTLIPIIAMHYFRKLSQSEQSKSKRPG